VSLSDGSATDRIPLQVSRGCVVASIQVDLTDDVLSVFRNDLLGRLDETGLTGVILDVSGVAVMDAEDFQALRATMAMAELMGARCIVSGMRPGVVSSVVELVDDVDGVEAAMNLDEAFIALERGVRDTEETEILVFDLAGEDDGVMWIEDHGPDSDQI
jgi:rsbT antagonist protein RsbS